MWPGSLSVNAVNLVKKIFYNSRDIEFFLRDYFLARPVNADGTTVRTRRCLGPEQSDWIRCGISRLPAVLRARGTLGHPRSLGLRSQADFQLAVVLYGAVVINGLTHNSLEQEVTGARDAPDNYTV